MAQFTIYREDIESFRTLSPSLDRERWPSYMGALLIKSGVHVQFRNGKPIGPVSPYRAMKTSYGDLIIIQGSEAY